MDWVTDYYEKNKNNISIKSLIDYVKSIRPNKIYKYQPFDDNRYTTLKNNEIWLSKRELLNDPFESNPLNHEKESVENILNSDNELLEQYLSPSIMEDWKGQFNIVATNIEEFYHHVAIASFSTTKDNYVMWGNYAEKNSGVCIEYDLTNSGYNPILPRLSVEKQDPPINLLNFLFPVEYINDRSDMKDILEVASRNHSDTEQTRVAEYISLLKKHEEWAYEKEWRIILPLNVHREKEKAGLTRDFMKPSAIYLGVNFNIVNLSKVKEFAENRKIPLYQTKINNTKDMTLKFIEVN